MSDRLREAQLQVLEIYKTVAELCERHGIRYFVDSGTLLGAVRHQGYIPWDDDIDIILWRDEFEKLKEILRVGLPSHLVMVVPDDNPFFFDFVVKIVDFGLPIKEDSPESDYYSGYVNKAALDILVLDYASRWRILQRGKVLVMKAIYAMAMAYRYRVEFNKYRPLSKLALFPLLCVGKLLPCSLIYRFYDFIARLDNGQPAPNCFGSRSTPPYLGRVIPSECYSGSIDLLFEGMNVPAPIGYHDILTITYGNYLVLPDECERRPIHMGS